MDITTTIINFFRDLINNDILTVIIISILPIIELRGAVPAAVLFGMKWYEAYFFSWLGSSLVAPFLLLLLMPILKAMKKWRGFRSLANAVESVFQDKASKIQTKADAAASEKHALIKKMIGVFAFVAVPLPLTGVWTGSAVAVFLGLKFWQALPMVLLGNLTAGAIMTTLSVCFADYVDIILTVFMILVLLVIVFYIVMLIVKMKKNKRKAMLQDAKTDVENSVESSEPVEMVETIVVEDDTNSTLSNDTKDNTQENVEIIEDNSIPSIDNQDKIDSVEKDK